MKTLLVLRHAKSSWEEPGLSDHDRPLKKRGLAAAPRMGRFAAERGLVPEAILSSTAARAESTAHLFAKACGFCGHVHLDSRIYDARVDDLLEVIGERTEGSVMIVGHNPTLEQLVSALTGEDERMPTAALAQIEISIAFWAHIAPGAGRLRGVWRPKNLKDR